ncbi:response regulator [Paenibacillus sp. CF384]|uniref:response regulator n=1 Tax=Paenibacillus sp. CF384 TaxID=1884382 RepID=UPI000894C3C2|nr:response regulator [Paenibacillus sp. CF384]SDW77146.1 two-component system, response regulator YesN [Paenibacillus sp. CF384]
MIQLMLVDDEPSVVDALALRIPWSSLGVVHVFKAYSGAEAWELFQSQQIDIVITDIRMPGMDGLELIRRVRAVRNRTQCLLLTGFAEFEYAQEALRSQVFDYLLKPIGNDELIASVSRLIARLTDEWQAISSVQRAAYTLREHLPLLRGNLLNDLLQDRRIDETLLAEKLNMLELPFRPGNRFCMLLIRMEGQFLNYSRQSINLFEYAVFNMAEELMSLNFDLWTGRDDHDYLVFLLQQKEDEVVDITTSVVNSDRLVELRAEELQHHVGLYLDGSISILLSPWGKFPNSVSDVYETMLQEMRKLIRGKSGIFKTVDTSPERVSMHSLHALYKPPLLNHLLEAGRWDDAQEKISSIIEEISAHWAESLEHINEAYYSLLASFHYIAHKSGKQLMDIAGIRQLELDTNGRRSPEQFRSWAEGILKLVKEELERDNRHANSAIILRVQQFAEEKLAEDVSLLAIANHVYLNSGYLSKLYKLETGENLSDYLYRLRMDKSAYYLTNTSLKIQDICERIGYQNTSYFIKMFKKHFRVTPQEYRNGTMH